jgi:hypothetical protein|tara:strand:- start:688 stop:813 length:126 start_codon:yes stop_codon:yes gene_type:complete
VIPKKGSNLALSLVEKTPLFEGEWELILSFLKGGQANTSLI